MSTKQKSKPVDIPLNVLRNITTYLDTIYSNEGGTVIIGGRAVNLQCSMSMRQTHDVDLVVPRRITESEIRELPQRAEHPDEFFEYSGDPKSKTRAKLVYNTILMRDPIDIDLYYPFYSTKSTGTQISRTIGGVIPVPIDAVLKEHETVKIGDMDFTVSRKEVLMVMKYNTWIERDKRSPISRDLKDMMNIVRNHGNGAAEFVLLINSIDSFMERYVPGKRIETVTGILSEIPYKKIENIDPNVKTVARDLLSRKYLLRISA